jgi:hypothetical protein
MLVSGWRQVNGDSSATPDGFRPDSDSVIFGELRRNKLHRRTAGGKKTLIYLIRRIS